MKKIEVELVHSVAKLADGKTKIALRLSGKDATGRQIVSVITGTGANAANAVNDLENNAAHRVSLSVIGDYIKSIAKELGVEYAEQPAPAVAKPALSNIFPAKKSSGNQPAPNAPTPKAKTKSAEQQAPVPAADGLMAGSRIEIQQGLGAKGGDSPIPSKQAF